MKRTICILLASLLTFALTACSGDTGNASEPISSEVQESTSSASVSSTPEETPEPVSTAETEGIGEDIPVPESFVLISGGTFDMGSPEDEPWRGKDETQHSVIVSDFYIDSFELTQEEYEKVMGENPSSFAGENLPVDNVSWLDAVNYCNARSQQEGLTPAYTMDGDTVSWNRAANGYRLPTEAEWEYACRAGTTTPFNTETSISAEESNYWGSYPYLIEDNYFSQSNLETQPGVYRQTTVAVDSFAPNALGHTFQRKAFSIAFLWKVYNIARQCGRVGLGLLRRLRYQCSDRSNRPCQWYPASVPGRRVERLCQEPAFRLSGSSSGGQCQF